MSARFRRRLAAEFIGTSGLLAAVVGSGIMGERLPGGNVAIALLASSLATGAALVALILSFGEISGAHFNPAVTCSVALQNSFPWGEVPLLCRLSNRGSVCGSNRGTRDVWIASTIRVVACTQRCCASFQRKRCYPGIAHGNCVSEPRARLSDAVCCGGVHRRRLLVHIFHFVRQSGGDARPIAQRHVAGIRLADVPGFLLGEIAGTMALCF
jgi:hypothetical protein